MTVGATCAARAYRLSSSAEGVDAIRDRLHPIALLLAGVADSGELGRIARLRRDDRERGKDVGAVANVHARTVELALAAHRHRAAAVRHTAAHRRDDLKEARVALPAFTQTRVDVLHRDRAAEDGGRRRG